MENKLKEIIAIPGVKSVFAINNKVELIAEQFNGQIDNEVAKDLGVRIVKIFGIGLYGKVQRKTTEIEMLLENSRVYALDCDHYNIVVLCESTVQTSMLRMSINVLVQTIQSDKKIQKALDEFRIDKKVLLRKENLSEEELQLIEKM